MSYGSERVCEVRREGKGQGEGPHWYGCVGGELGKLQVSSDPRQTAACLLLPA